MTKLSRETIAAEAIALCDEEGVGALSMRKVAARLGVGTMSLYHYVRTKDELLALMSDGIMGELLLDEVPSGWREGLRAIALSTKAAFDRHGWLLDEMLSGSGQAAGNGVRHFEQSVSTLAELDLPREERLHIISLVDEYAFGFIISHGENQRQVANDEQMDEALTFIEEQFATGAFPHAATLVGEGEDFRDVTRELFTSIADGSRFERGLDIVLDGIEAHLRRLGALG